MQARTVLIIVIVICLFCACEAKKKKHSKKKLLRQKETNPVDFIRLTVMRVIYGIATRVGFGEQISEALNGAFVPPGADYDSDEYDDDFDY
ncbi:uncharacterized protein LOC130443337 [Diorhabda sublineata]|uniref:uncharacterized protein LOC130443337 n=1 Tax=Diorhabda sublineata TaxID=1163346 RepID=UPI0024E12B7B|nr:uncharacterized protein LOC130443337 [Diorhabda sublineata]